MSTERLASAALGEDVGCRVHALGADPRHAAYLWHGRGGRGTDWDVAVPGVASLVEAGRLPALLLVAPDAPWSDGGHWWADSLFTGEPVGRPVETAVVRDLVAAVEARHGVVPDREHRVVAGCSMGAAAAVRHLLAHSDVFASGVALAPPLWHPQPPPDSSARAHGAFGVGAGRFSERRWSSAHDVRPALPVRLALSVGVDDDLAPVTRAGHHRLAGVPGVVASLDEMPGAHDWDAWVPGLLAGLGAVLGQPVAS